MARVSEIVQLLSTIAPPSLALDFDNSGLNVCAKNDEVSGIMIALDVTEEIVEEAKRENCNLIISHHPLIFSKIGNLVEGVATNDTVISAIQNEISVYSMHTNLDTVSGGINDAMATVYGMKNTKILIKNGENSGIGRIGEVSSTTVKELAKQTKKEFLAPVKYNDITSGNKVEIIAVFNGAGLDEQAITLAKEQGAQVVISAEIKHHIALFAKSKKISVIETGHYGSEKFYLPCLAQKIEEVLRQNDIKVVVKLSKTEIDPMPYTV